MYRGTNFLWKIDEGPVLLEVVPQSKQLLLKRNPLKTINILYLFYVTQILFNSQHFQFLRCYQSKELFKVQEEGLTESFIIILAGYENREALSMALVHVTWTVIPNCIT